ncbi:MAG: hypothetical protein EXR07_14255 [Acetobacteraceae bacterium]|nr:hypothetical protein [Acetobacteraceae bacterium]
MRTAGTNALGVQNGVFRYDTLNASLSTGWDRDTVQASFTWSVQSAVTGSATAANTSSDVKTASLSWTRSLRPDLTLSTSGTYSLIRRSGTLGGDTSFSTAVGLQYTMSDTTAVSARYSFFNRVSRIPGYGLYENILLLGLTKQF